MKCCFRDIISSLSSRAFSPYHQGLILGKISFFFPIFKRKSQSEIEGKNKSHRVRQNCSLSRTVTDRQTLIAFRHNRMFLLCTHRNVICIHGLKCCTIVNMATCLWGFPKNTGAYQHPRSLISAFVILFFESIICKLATGEIAIF